MDRVIPKDMGQSRFTKQFEVWSANSTYSLGEMKPDIIMLELTLESESGKESVVFPLRNPESAKAAIAALILAMNEVWPGSVPSNF